MSPHLSGVFGLVFFFGGGGVCFNWFLSELLVVDQFVAITRVEQFELLDVGNSIAHAWCIKCISRHAIMVLRDAELARAGWQLAVCSTSNEAGSCGRPSQLEV